jgi:membrane complex biogenesis BtpA family protein
MSQKPVQKTSLLRRLFGVERPIIGMLHLPPLPGSPHYGGQTMAEIVQYTLSDLDVYIRGGVNGFIVENHGDIPFLKPEDIGPETIAAMSVAAAEVVGVARPGKYPVGINCLANNAFGALAVAKASMAEFVRVNQWVNAYIANEGFVEGKAGKALRYRSHIGADKVAIFADVNVKHGSHSITADRSIAEQVRDALFFDADVLIATGSRTGDATSIETITEIREASNVPVLVGSGVDVKNVEAILEAADGAIVGSSLKEEGIWQNRVDIDRVRTFMEKVKRLRSSMEAGA